MSPTQDPIEAFSLLPNDVQSWLNSRESWYKTMALNDRLNLHGSRSTILPDLVFRLVTGGIQPQDFVATVALRLGVSDNAARAITRELEKEILHPIEGSLRVGSGIEVQMLHFEGDKTLPEVARFEETTPSTNNEFVSNLRMSAPIAVQENIIMVEGKIAAAGIPPRNDTGIGKIAAPTSDAGIHHDVVTPGHWEHVAMAPAVPTGPVILHTEKEEAKPQEQAPRPIFPVKIPTNKKQYVSAPAPLAAMVEVPEAFQSSKFKVESGKVTDSEKLRVPARTTDVVQSGGESQKEEQRLASSVQQPETRLQPPMRALSDLHTSGTLKVESRKENTEASKSIAPRSLATPPVQGKIATSGIPPRNDISMPMPSISPAPKIIPVVATVALRPAQGVTRRVVHYSDWRTLI